MNVDCLKQVLLHCHINDVITCNSVTNDFNKIINDDDFWKLLVFRDFKDINKSTNEKWLDYYKRRNINYGIPIQINNQICLYNQVKQFISLINDKGFQNLILTKDNDMYMINNNGFILINHSCKIKKIYGSKDFYFVDIKNSLYQIISEKILKLLKVNIKHIVIDHKSNIYYTDNTRENLTYFINNKIHQRILNFEFLDLLNLDIFDYIINNENDLLIGKIIDKKYVVKKFETKAIQLARINTTIALILRIDGFVILCKNEDFRVLKIPNVKMLGTNSFLTHNGDLYYLNKTYKPILLDTDVIDVSYVTNDGEDGCYVKRSIV